jgi:two-component sensor histidine kinase
MMIVLAAVLAAMLIRVSLANVAPHLTYVTYFPAVLIGSVLTGWRYGSACAVLCGIVALALFPAPVSASFPYAAPLASLALFVSSCAIIIATAEALRRAVRDLASANRSAQTLNHELQHRVANTLTVVQALATQSARNAKPEEFLTIFNGRLQALAKAHQLLGGRELTTCTLPVLIDEACQPFCADANIIKTGPICQIPAESCVPLVLALHELCTNSVKYGALSTGEGRVEIGWTFAEALQRVTILWTEVGGPRVSKPTRRGLGSALLRPQPGIVSAEQLFDEAGVSCRLVIEGAEQIVTSRARGAAAPGTELSAAGHLHQLGDLIDIRQAAPDWWPMTDLQAGMVCLL